ncbi:MAG: 2-phospho-L-lactate transferase CofD family protein [Candidatus Shapirobacteria bacterium]|nr:2-phospho-L-lactate transferase CofD family protein [Candidatus Shapirobacteria bacterium]
MRNNYKICTMGCGSGMPVVNKALIKATYCNIKSIVTTFDSGGDSGRMRTDERGNILAFSDYWRALISLWNDGEQKNAWEEMLRFRDGRGRNFGNLFFQFMSERVGNLSEVDELFSHLTGARIIGKVIPVAVEPGNVCFKTISGKEYCGEHNLDNLRMSDDRVKTIWLEPKVKANEEAIQAINEAEIIVVSPGSMYGSVITNFLAEGMIEAYKRSKAKKILMTNIMSVANENSGFDQNDYVNVFKRYLGDVSPFELVLIADLGKLDQKKLAVILKYYEKEHSYPIKYEKRSKIKVRYEDIAIIEEKNNTLRHSEEKLAKIFARMLYVTKEAKKNQKRD